MPWVTGCQIAPGGTAGDSRVQPTSLLVARVGSNVMTISFHLVLFESNMTFVALHGQPQTFPEKAEEPNLFLHVEIL